jgi:hypothetical protein
LCHHRRIRLTGRSLFRRSALARCREEPLVNLLPTAIDVKLDQLGP